MWIPKFCGVKYIYFGAIQPDYHEKKQKTFQTLVCLCPLNRQVLDELLWKDPRLVTEERTEQNPGALFVHVLCD